MLPGCGARAGPGGGIRQPAGSYPRMNSETASGSSAV